MILVDTSVWVDHLRHSEPELIGLLDDGRVLTHLFVIEELACGNLPERDDFLEHLHALPAALMAEHEEVLRLILNERLNGTGLGSVDVHLIASAKLMSAQIWTTDKALLREARRLSLAF